MVSAAVVSAGAAVVYVAFLLEQAAALIETAAIAVINNAFFIIYHSSDLSLWFYAVICAFAQTVTIISREPTNKSLLQSQGKSH